MAVGLGGSGAAIGAANVGKAALAKPASVVDPQLAVEPFFGEHQGGIVTPQQLGIKASVDKAVRAALAATPRSRIGLPVRYSEAELDAYVAGLAKRFGRKPRSASASWTRRWSPART